jgi:type IV secretion system protein VirB9
VYNDGVRTYIELPPRAEAGEAPVRLVLRRDRRLFKRPETTLVNYRLQGRRYVVDQVFDRAILVAGVGRNQERVEIRRISGD